MLRKLERKKFHPPYFTRDGRGPLPGASSVCKIGDDPGGLIHWAYKKGCAGEDYREERDDAAEAGDIGHALTEAFLNGDELDLSDFSSEALRLGALSCEKFKIWWSEQGLTFVHSELRMISHEHLFGGTLDIVGLDPDNKNCLIDLKTTKSLRLSQSIQAAGGYKTAYDENFPDNPIDRVCVIRLPKDDKGVEPMWLPPEHFPAYQRAFLANLEAYYARRFLETVDPIEKARPPWFKKGYKRK